jgi:hypothetical protein
MFHAAHDIRERWLLKTSSRYLNLIAAQPYFDPQGVRNFDDAFFHSDLNMTQQATLSARILSQAAKASY